ncbi:MAG: hypothetical protein FWB85_06115 [Chitinispirillia bacterium]|nr:hypothetical protein [Chitinispirillia bacterium]MCL2241792.1 hypothetical protein [Chitinispirillia bacterium]
MDTLTIYDASGNVIKKVPVRDNPILGNNPRHQVDSWDLTDRKGRPVSEGAYLIRGAITVNGKKEWMVVTVGVR